ncbi:MAG: PaaI family thioesterase [Acidimicrobiales bacterium]
MSDEDETCEDPDVVEDPETLEAFTRAFRDAVPLHDRMGITCLKRGPETIVSMELNDDVRGGVPGTVHGGILASFADIACAIALWGAYDPMTEVTVTTDMHVRYYRQPDGGPLVAEARRVHHGRRLLSSECSIFDAKRRVLARATATYMLVSPKGRIDLPSNPLAKDPRIV